VRDDLILLSPLSGWSAPLEEVPDPVFAGRMLGDGLAIDPTGPTLNAPCDGTVILAPSSGHAVTIRARNGAEILLHVGIDTVALGGEGFVSHVKEGQEVRSGQLLVSFDLELLAQRAKSLLTPVIVTHQGGFTISRRNQGQSLQVGDFLMEVTCGVGHTPTAGAHSTAAEARPASADARSTPAVTGVPAPAAGGTVAREFLVSLEHGIHARPAAVLASSLKGYGADVSIIAGDRRANARSAVALMALGIRRGDRITIEASGADASAALTALARALDNIVEAPTSPKHAVSAPSPDPDDAAPSSDNELKGVIASRGLAVGVAVQFARPEIEVTESGAAPEREKDALDRARSSVRDRLQRTVESSDGPTREISQAHLEMLEDPELVAGAQELIARGKSAGYAWRQVLHRAADTLRTLDDARMAERAADLLDLEAQVLTALGGQTSARAPALPESAVLIANELLPSQLVALDSERLAAVAMAAGGPTSHAAILAAAMGIPALVALGPGALHVATGTPVVVDAEAGRLYVNPPEAQLGLVRSRLAARRNRRNAELSAAQRECRSADGVRIEVFANVGSVAEAHAAVVNGAEGCGLLRTEFLFLERKSPPDEAEQLDQYQRIATALEGRPLTIRTLDIGGDKPIPYLPLPREENPALGLRGVRTSLWKPDLLRVQLRAILKVVPAEQCRVLLPMITDPSEIRTVRRVLDELQSETGQPRPLVLGVMIETPASAVMADRMAREADFLSIGTNDLTQYTLAMDRGHPELAARLDGLHPAVLRLIAAVARAAREKGRSVAVCGGLASDPAAVPILIGLGVHELSMVPSVIPQLKALIATRSMADYARLATEALERESAEEVRALTLAAWPTMDTVSS